MFVDIRFWWAQRSIHSQMDALSFRHGQALENAKSDGADPDELARIGHEYFMEHTLLEDELKRLTSGFYIRLGTQLLVPLPEFNEHSGSWIESETRPGSYHLSPKALGDLRNVIRAELKDRREEWTVWLTLAVGVIGALTGLVAVILK